MFYLLSALESFNFMCLSFNFISLSFNLMCLIFSEMYNM